MHYTYLLSACLFGLGLAQPISAPEAAVEQRAPPNYAEDFKPLKQAKIDVLKHLKEGKDLPVFLGNTGGYIYYTLTGEEKSKYQAVSVPFSGGTTIQSEANGFGKNEFNKNLPDFWNNVIGPVTNGKKFDRIVLIDNSESGKSPDGFKFVWDKLAETHKEIHEKDWLFINVGDENEKFGKPSFKMEEVKVKSKSLMTDIKNDKYSRVVVQYNYPLWNMSPAQVLTTHPAHMEGYADVQAALEKVGQ